MSFRNRKQILSDAKNKISVEHQDRVEKLHSDLQKLKEELGEDYFDHPSYNKARDKYNEAWRASSEWNASKHRKKKKSIEWKDDRTMVEVKHSKPRREVNWEAAREVVDENKSTRKNNSSWLQEGVMVVHKDSRDKPMIVVEVDENIVRALLDGDLRSFRALSLRPAYED